MTEYGPGHNGFAFRADTYCVDCGQALVNHLAVIDTIDSGDSNDYPQPIFFGESDSQVFCADCDDFLYGDEFGFSENDSRIETNPLYRRQMRDAGRGNQLP